MVRISRVPIVKGREPKAITLGDYSFPMYVPIAGDREKSRMTVPNVFVDPDDIVIPGMCIERMAEMD